MRSVVSQTSAEPAPPLGSRVTAYTCTVEADSVFRDLVGVMQSRKAGKPHTRRILNAFVDPGFQRVMGRAHAAREWLAQRGTITD